MLVFRQSMAAHLRRPLDTGTDGRLVGGYFDLGGKTCLLASVYVHSGVDRMAVGSDDIISVQALYARILRWSSDRLVHRALIMGDFNETCSPMDRSENLHGSLYRRCISSLLDDGFIDCSARCILSLGSPVRPRFQAAWPYLALITSWPRDGATRRLGRVRWTIS
jgi:hypothetical protein